MVPLTQDDLAHLPLPTKRVVEVLGFVPGQEIDPISYGRLTSPAPMGRAPTGPTP